LIKSRKSVFIAIPMTTFIMVEFAMAFIKQGSVSKTETGRFIYQFLFEQNCIAGICLLSFITVTAFFSVYTLVYAVVSHLHLIEMKKIKKLISNTDVIERYYVIFGFTIMAISILILYSITDLFHTTVREFDIIFNADSPSFIKTDAFFRFYHEENDIRHPLFALATIPFAIIAKIVVSPLFFITYAYTIVLQLMQVFLLLITTVLIVRMTEVKDKISHIFLLLLFTTSFPFLLFTFTVEQYIIPTFMLILVIYLKYFNHKVNTHLLALTSGLFLTNAIIVLFITYDKKIKEWIVSLSKVLASFLVMCVFCGKVPELFNAFEKLSQLMYYTNPEITRSSIGYKVYQFSHFGKNIILAPASMIFYDEDAWVFWQAIPTGISYIGLTIFFLSFFGALLSLRSVFARLCSLWVIFATFLLFVIGWGSVENGMILYSLYFGWAFIVLVFLFMEKIFANVKQVKYMLYAVVLMASIYFNSKGIMEMIKFGLEYYPVN